MKCSICGAEWTPPKGNNSFNSVCPFCGANLTEKAPDSLDDVLSVIVLNHGLDTLKNERITLGLFADYAPKLKREHSLLKQFYNCEGSVVLFRALSSNDTESELLRNKVVARMCENWIADEAALLVCNSFLRAIGLKPLEHPVSDTQSEKSLTENDVRLSSTDVREYYCKIRDLINVTWKIYQKKKRQAVSITIQDIRAVNGRIHIFINAPRDVSGFSVFYRFDQFPAGPSDPEAVKQQFTKIQYANYRAILLGAPEERTYYFTVYAWFDRDGEREWSPGVEQVFDCSPKVTIDYSISSVHGPFGRGFVILEFQANVKRFTLPDIDVMSAVRTIPLFRDSASLLYTIQSQNVDGSLRIKIPLSKGTPKDTYIKPFLRDEAAETRNCLRLKVRSSHKIT